MHLYMTEIGVRDWPRGVAWYRDVMELPILILDELRRFALFGSETGRIALKERGEGTSAPGVQLSFEVRDLDAERLRLELHGVATGSMIVDAEEHFRTFRIVDPEGVAIQIFAWIDPTGSPVGHPLSTRSPEG